ncbi:MAG: MATE family efflux transporter [Lachnospiraceae bacterium]|nr:MATE family efflux transporter [Lachnospiraceae bacterium]
MQKVDFDNGSITKNIIRTALPMLVAQVISLLYSVVDRIYIGRIEGYGTQALGAIGLCFPIVMLIGGFTNMFGLGGAPLFSIGLGKNDRKKAGEVLNTAFRLEIIVGAILILCCELFARRILSVFGATAEELRFSVPYIRIYLLGTIFTMVATGMNPYINAQGYAVIGMKSVLVGAVSNIILDPVFIFLLGLGVNGAAVATVIAQFLSMLFVVRFLLGADNEFQICFQNFFTFPHAKEIVSLGLSPFIMQCTNSLVSVACNSVLMRTGGALYVSVMTIISSVRQILDTPIMAVTEGASPTISYNYGAGRPRKVRQAVTLVTVTAVLYTCLMWLVIERFPLLFIKIFSDDPVLQQLALRPLHLYFFAFVFQAFQYSGQTTFKALNKKKQTIFFSLFRKAIMVVPLTYLLPFVFHMGADGVFMAEPVSNVIGGLACFSTMMITVVPELKRMETGRGGEE